MNPKNQAGQERSRYLKPSQNAPDQHRIGRLQKNVDHMVAARVFSEEVILNPKDRVGDREIICRSRAGPDFAQSGKTAQQRIRSHQGLVIPNKTGVQRGQISKNNREKDCPNLCYEEPAVA